MHRLREEKTAAKTGVADVRRLVSSVARCAGKNPFREYAYGRKVLEITP
jgi:hypothetical protein